MKNIGLALIGLLFIGNTAYADTVAAPEQTVPYPPVNWVSKDNNDIVTINNGTNANLSIHITVNQGKVGIDLKNCGKTTHIDAGSSAICLNTDSRTPVNFSSDDPNSATSGTYEIHQESN